MQRPGNVGVPGVLWPDSSTDYAGPLPVQQQLQMNMMNPNSGGPNANLWNLDSNTSANPSDRASLLGTKQWGRESGGAPWGQNNPSEQSTSSSLPMQSPSNMLSGNFGAEATSTAGNMRHSSSGIHFNIAEYVLGGPGTEAHGGNTIQPAVESCINNGNGPPPQSRHLESSQGVISDQNHPREISTRADSGEENPAAETENGSQGPLQLSPSQMMMNIPGSTVPTTSVNPQSSSTKSAESTSVRRESTSVRRESTVPVSKENEPVELPSADHDMIPEQQNNKFPCASDVDFGDNQATATTIEGVLQQQMSQLSLDYNAQQQSLAVQLAVQQQYMLAAQQQQLAAMPGVFLPNPYIIATPNTPGYPDPTSSGQFPMISQYPAYAAWPNMAYPPMITSQMAVSQQPGSSNQGGMMENTMREKTSPSSSAINAEGQEGATAPQQAPFYPEMLANAALSGQGSGYQMIPAAYYDQNGNLIVNSGRGPLRLFPPGVPAPVFINGSQPSQTPTIYASPTISGGSTPVPLPGPNQGLGGSFTPVGQQGGFGSTGGVNNLGSLMSGMGSQSSTPQRRDSFSDYAKHQQYGSNISQFYNPFGVSPGAGSLGVGAISPSPGSHGTMGSHQNMSPPPLSSTNNFLGNNRMFSVAPGAEAKYRNGGISSIFGTSGSSLFPPTRIRPMSNKDMLVASGRSRLLDDFRNNRFSNPQLRDLSSHIVEFSRDQHGSRFIQQKLERATTQEKQMVFSEIAPAAHQLMTDVFGNYVIQKFFEFGTQEQKQALAKCIKGQVLSLALQMYGCRVIQKALECIPQEEQIDIVKELDGHLIKCVKDQNGNHVVQKCIECIVPSQLQFIIDAFKGQVIGLSMHPYGCRVMQRILEHCTPEQTQPILDELHQNYETLVTDQYGNYVIQHILEHGRLESKSKIVQGIRGQVLKLSQHKFASNVVEKCVSHSSRIERSYLIEEACQEPDALMIMMKDQFANYVVQKMIDVAEPTQRNLLITKIRPHMAQLRKFTYGKHIIAKLEKCLLKSQASATGAAPSAVQAVVCTQAVVLPRDMATNLLRPNP